ncbi:MAG: zinc ribbon domain-containing protein [Candidatus Heimdallarchaeota archaeon]|nr:zinc ribbon domain-containing protein [Candidatus Heimdallarchaeota archaeon]
MINMYANNYNGQSRSQYRSGTVISLCCIFFCALWISILWPFFGLKTAFWVFAGIFLVLYISSTQGVSTSSINVIAPDYLNRTRTAKPVSKDVNTYENQYCINCGQGYAKESKYCPHCGTKSYLSAT